MGWLRASCRRPAQLYVWREWKSRPDTISEPRQCLRRRRLALPDRLDRPPVSFERGDRPRIAAPVRRELCLPELPVPLRHGRARATLVRVPIAAVNEHGPAPCTVGHVGRPREIAIANSEAMPEGVQHAAHAELGLRVALRNAPQTGRCLWVRDQRSTGRRIIAVHGRRAGRRSVRSWPGRRHEAFGVARFRDASGPGDCRRPALIRSRSVPTPQCHRWDVGSAAVVRDTNGGGDAGEMRFEGVEESVRLSQ